MEPEWRFTLQWPFAKSEMTLDYCIVPSIAYNCHAATAWNVCNDVKLLPSWPVGVGMSISFYYAWMSLQ